MSQALKPSELKCLLCHGIKNYRLKVFLSGGSFPKVLLENILNKEEVVGKIVSSPSDGDLKLWPKLRHENLNPLLETLSMDCDENVRILLSPAVGKCIGLAIHDISFIQHPLCFERKKYYAKGVLSGLSYLHRNSMYVLNLSDKSVEIHAYDDKAVICDFSCMVVQKKIAGASLSFASDYKPPEAEVANNEQMLNSLPIDMWYCGLLFLQIFTQHMLPWCGFVKDCLNYLNYETLKKANIGSCLKDQAACDLKKFLQSLLCQNPNLRKSASDTLKSNFLQSIRIKIDKKARHFWENGGNAIHRDSSNSFHEDNSFKNKYKGSICSEIDVITVSEDDISANMSSNDVIYSEISSSYLFRTKSEPPGKMNHKVRVSSLQTHTSFPSLSKRAHKYSDSSERSSSSEINNIDIEFCKDLLPDNYESECSEDSNETVSSIKHSPYDVFLTEWDADISSNLDESVRYQDLGEKIDKRNSISNDSYTKQLKTVLHQNISKNLLTEDSPPLNNLIERQPREGKTKPNFSGNLVDEDVNLSCQTEEQNSYRELGYANLNYGSGVKLTRTSTNCSFPSQISVKSLSPCPKRKEYSSDTDVLKKCRRRTKSAYDRKNNLTCNQSNTVKDNIGDREKSASVISRKSTSPVNDEKKRCSCRIKPKLSSVQSETMVDNVTGSIIVQAMESNNRRKWYHLLLCTGCFCFGCKNRK